MKLSIVVPVYQEKDNLYNLYDDLKANVLDVIDYDYEIIMVDDGSTDNSYEIMKNLAEKDNNIKIYKLSRNFGSHTALICGLSKTTGDCAVFKSADMQEPSELLIQMVDEWKKGYNVVLAQRDGREESFLQRFFANSYYFMVRNTALPNMPKKGADIYLLDRKVINVIDSLDEKNSSIMCQILWSGFKTSAVHYIRKARTRGKSGWSLKKKVKLTFDTLYGFSNFPVQLVKFTGILSLLGAGIWGLLAIIPNRINMDSFSALAMMGLSLFGISMLALGGIGGYVWRTFDASRRRPLYIIEDSNENSHQ